ncbi:putative HTH-type transcriptional regulator YybR [Actinomadura rubteroloni]|uniref:Putative HTH-type transcriptional regulator YybR n=1 Tax=Actinomadura rubteroloni TaxID=1926885 RepID=A0A2P4UQV1_9ACTN|nr:helix-turn-helix domain-containing protein [Actinomadura rubteroloni]POM27413.1 putative HTH-type transcriptional regulator YybR [Actinomadura rubteroloni]
MVRRTRLDDSECPVARSVDAIGDWWSLLIVRDAFDGSRRFGEFQRSLGVAKNILAARLRALVDGGVLASVPARDGGAHREYVLTEKGEALFPVVVALRQWGEGHFFAPGEERSRLVDRRDGRPLRPLEVRAGDGRPVAPADTVVEKPGG